MIKAKYTVVLNELLENEQVKPLITKAMSTYPLYTKKSEEKYIPAYIPTREELNKKILNFYKYREIGFETVGRFIDELEISLNEIMPYYNQLFLTIDQDFEMIYNVDYKNEHTITREGTETSNTSSSSVGNSENEVKDSTISESIAGNTNKAVNSKTPQSQVNISASEIDNINYADEVNWNNGTANENGKSTGESSSTTKNNVTGTGTGQNDRNDSEKFEQRIFGNYGQMSYQSLIAKYRENVINIEQEIINNHRISELFMLIY